MYNKNSLKNACVALPLFFLFAFPASTNYQLKSFEFGGGGGVSDSSNYSMEGVLGEVAGEQSSTNFGVDSGLVFVQNSNVPSVTLTNPSNWYNKLRVIIGTEDNPSDATYAIAISTDDFATTNYVQSDNTVGATLGVEDYQTYANWGSASGEEIIGLVPNTTYKVKAKALQGEYIESAWGEESSAATMPVTLSFDLDIGAASNADTDPPYNIDMGTLTVGGVTTASNKVWIDFATNADYGGFVYVYGTNNGLRSSNTNYTIASVTDNLTSASDGYGLQAANSSGLTPASPYDGASENVGIVNTSIREIFNSASSPVVGGRGSITLKAKASATTPASNDYTDTLTIISAASF